MGITSGRRNRRLIIAFLLGIGIVVLSAVPSRALDSEILNQTAHNMVHIEAWWDDLWENTFNPPPLDASPSSIANGEGMEGSTNLSLYAFAYPARLVLTIGVFGWIFQYGYKIYESKGVADTTNIFFKMFFPFFIAVLLLADYGGNARMLAYAFRDISNSWSDGILELSIADINLRTALQDQLLTEDAKEAILQRWEACAAMPQPEVALPSPYRPTSLPPQAANPPTNSDPNTSLPPPPPEDGNSSFPPVPPVSQGETAPITLEQRQAYDYLDCLRNLSFYTKSELERAEQEQRCAGVGCRVFKNLYRLAYSVAITSYEQELESRLTEDGLVDPGTRAELEALHEARIAPDQAETLGIDAELFYMDTKEFMAFLMSPGKNAFFASQWMYMSFLELALFLMALLAPIYVAFSMIPGKRGMLGAWVIQSFTVAFARFAYFAIIGVFAVQRENPSNLAAVLDQTFFLTLGIFAPMISFSGAAIGGLAAASSYKSAAVGAGTAVLGTASGVAATTAHTIARSLDKKR